MPNTWFAIDTKRAVLAVGSRLAAPSPSCDMRHSIDYVGAHWRPKPKNQARLRAVDLEARVDIVLSLLQQDPAGCLNGLLFEMSAGPVVYNQIDRALLRLRQLDTPKSAVHTQSAMS